MTLFQKSTIRYLILTALVALCGSVIFGQSDVQGKVMDGTGNPVINAKISIEGQVLVRTNEAGRYRITVQPGDIINVEKDGYKPGNCIFTGQDIPVVLLERDFYLQSSSIAYGMEDNSSRTSAISTVSGDELAWFPTQILSAGLAGMLSGLTVMQTSGEPGENSPQMLIRGKSTLSNNDFLIYVDGFEADLDQLIASEIESISVLKDAASLAPFGMRGANGVLWVTTKRGLVSPLRINVESRAGFSQVLQKPSFLDAYGYASLYNEAFSNDAGTWTPVYSDDELNKYKNGEDPVFYPNIDWYEKNRKNITPYTENQISMQGGTKVAKYYLMLGYRFPDDLAM